MLTIEGGGRTIAPDRTVHGGIGTMRSRASLSLLDCSGTNQVPDQFCELSIHRVRCIPFSYHLSFLESNSRLLLIRVS